MSLQVRRPEDTVIQLSDGEWILVKKWLNAGEDNDMKKRMYKKVHVGIPDEAGVVRPEVEYDVVQMAGFSKAVAYLLDWSAKDPDGKPLVIREKSAEIIQESLNSIPPEAFKEITDAIQAHEEAMVVALKNAQAGGSASPAISTSVVQ